MLKKAHLISQNQLLFTTTPITQIRVTINEVNLRKTFSIVVLFIEVTFLRATKFLCYMCQSYLYLNKTTIEKKFLPRLLCLM